MPENYSDLVDANEIPRGLPKWIYQGMERHLPTALLRAPRVEKLALMQRVLAGQAPSPEEFARVSPYVYISRPDPEPSSVLMHLLCTYYA
jgi:hypothetical protein